MSYSYLFRKLCNGLALLLGVTLISFCLMVYFGPDQTYSLLGKNPTQADIILIQKQLGYDLPFFQRYLDYLWEVFSFDFGHSSSNQERISSIFARTIPVSLGMILPGFIIGNILSIAIALLAAYHRSAWQDKFIMFFAVTGMSLSFIIVIILVQAIFCSSYGLDLFPVQGWEVETFGDYCKYVTVPSMALIFITVGYNTRYYRAVLLEEMGHNYVQTSKAFGCHPIKLLVMHVLKNSMIPILTRITYMIPFTIMGGSLLIESYFNIPGIGSITHDAITSGDLPVLKAVVSTSTILYIGILILTDILYTLLDPRITLP